MSNTSDSYQSFIIHLKRAGGRRAQVENLREKSPFETQILDAVDGSLLDEKQISACLQNRPMHQPAYPFKINSGEVGCFLSHRNAWQMIVDRNLTAGLIFEDDVEIDEAVFRQSLEFAKRHSRQRGYIQFQVRDIKTAYQLLAQDGNTKLISPSVTPLRCSAQLVSYEAAKELLKLTEKFDRPVDTFLQMHWITNVKLACIIPSGVSDRTQETGGSTLSIKQPWKQKLSREWSRAVYRFKVQYYSKRHKTRA